MALAPRLLIIADRGQYSSDDAWCTSICALLEGCSADPEWDSMVRVQVRLKDLTERPQRLRVVARRLRECGLLHRALLNGSTEEARDLGFGGVHWPEALIGSAEVNPSPEFLFGASVHGAEAARRAAAAGAHYVLFGPVYDAGSKVARGVGLGALQAVTKAAELPVLAVGGIETGRVGACHAHGAHGVGVVTGILKAHAPLDAAGAYVAALRELGPWP